MPQPFELLSKVTPEFGLLPYEVLNSRPLRKGWGGRPCPVAACRKQVAYGGLCLPHYDPCYESVRESLELRGLESPMTLQLNDQGYVRVTFKGGRALSLHKVIMEYTLQRELVDGENVHHMNGRRADNRPSNLELWVISQPAGQRPKDLAVHARELLGRYGTPEEQLRYRGTS